MTKAASGSGPERPAKNLSFITLLCVVLSGLNIQISPKYAATYN